MSVIAREALVELAERAGAIARARAQGLVPERKADRTLVTALDRDVETFLVRELARRLPAAHVLGEEGTRHAGTGSVRVVIDPIDGTGALLAGLPTWSVTIGVLDDGAPIAGVVHLPMTGETYSAADGMAWWNAERLPALGTAPAPAETFVVSHAKAHLRHAIRYPGKLRSLGSTAYHVALVARGAAEAALVGHVRLWDLAGPAALLAAVDGEIRTLRGVRLDLGSLVDGRPVPDYLVAAPRARMEALLPLLGGRS